MRGSLASSCCLLLTGTQETTYLKKEKIVATQPLPEKRKGDGKKPQIVEKPTTHTWSRPQAMAIPKEGYFKLERGRYGPIFPQTPACYGFSVIGKVKPGRERA